MRVALNAWFWDSPTSGSGQYARCLVERLIALRADLQVILVVPDGRKRGARSKRQEAGGKRQEAGDGAFASCVLHPVPCSRSDLGKVLFEQVVFPRACRRLGADVAHVPYWAPPLRPAVPTIATIHDLIPLLLPEYRRRPLVRLYTALVSAAAHRTALVLTDSAASRGDILTHLDLPAGRVRTIYLAADTCYTPVSKPEDVRIRARYGLPGSYILYLGGFDVRKNVEAAVEAYCRAAPVIGQACPLAIVGRLPERDSPFMPNPHRLIRQAGLDETQVHFAGYVEERDKPAIYRGAVVFLFPSRHEGFGLPPLEALACGVPVVGSTATSLPEIVGDAGMLFPADDIAGMADALVRLVSDARFHAELSRRALAQAARFSWERTAQETLAAYREAADARVGT